MASPQLPNYLRTNRKRLGLSQDDVAHLLGTGNGTTVCRHEQFDREPGLRAALAYEAVFRRPIRELFAGLYDEIEREVAGRAKKLVVKTASMKPGQRTARKRETLAKIAGVKSNKPQKA